MCVVRVSLREPGLGPVPCPAASVGLRGFVEGLLRLTPRVRSCHAAPPRWVLVPPPGPLRPGPFPGVPCCRRPWRRGGCGPGAPHSAARGVCCFSRDQIQVGGLGGDQAGAVPSGHIVSGDLVSTTWSHRLLSWTAWLRRRLPCVSVARSSLSPFPPLLGARQQAPPALWGGCGCPDAWGSGFWKEQLHSPCQASLWLLQTTTPWAPWGQLSSAALQGRVLLREAEARPSSRPRLGSEPGEPLDVGVPSAALTPGSVRVRAWQEVGGSRAWGGEVLGPHLGPVSTGGPTRPSSSSGRGVLGVGGGWLSVTCGSGTAVQTEVDHSCPVFGGSWPGVATLGTHCLRILPSRAGYGGPVPEWPVVVLSPALATALCLRSRAPQVCSAGGAASRAQAWAV